MDINYWQFLAGLGLFLFAMHQLEKALSNLSSNRFKAFLRKHTHSPVKAIFGGTLATAIMQSSSLVGLMTLALAGAGILELRHAIGIVLGSNLGTTVTGWLVTTLGFKLSLGNLALPLIALGALGFTLLPTERQKNWARLGLAIGFLLFGLGYMKDAMEVLQSQFDISAIKEQSWIIMFLAGALFTAVIQSSSGTMVITLSALNAGIIDLHQGAALIIGADLGTTSTLLLGGMPGSPLQRQIAAAHFFFNLTVDLLALAALPILLWLVNDVYLLNESPLLALVALHSSFNFFGILLFLPLLNVFSNWLNRLFPLQSQRPLESMPATLSDLALMAMTKNVEQLLRTVLDLNRHCFKIKETFSLEQYTHTYDALKQQEVDILKLGIRLQQQRLPEKEAIAMETLHQVAREALISAKELKDILENLIQLRHHESNLIKQRHEELKKQQKAFYSILQSNLDHPQSSSAYEKLNNIDNLINNIHSDLHNQIMPLLTTTATQGICPTLLNINRDLYLSNRALAEAMSLYCEHSAKCITPAYRPPL